jgi:hypothetical protein
MIANNPETARLQRISDDVAIAQSVYEGWARNESHNTRTLKDWLDSLLAEWECFPRRDDLHNSERLTSHFEELAACRVLFASHAEPNGPWGDHTISEAGKRAIIMRVKGCLSQLRAEAEGMLRSMAIN